MHTHTPLNNLYTYIQTHTDTKSDIHPKKYNLTLHTYMNMLICTTHIHLYRKTGTITNIKSYLEQTSKKASANTHTPTKTLMHTPSNMQTQTLSLI